MVADWHLQYDPTVMRKSVGQPIDRASRQANPEITASDPRIIHEALDLSQTSLRDFGIDVDKPKDVTVRGTSGKIHLYRSIALAYDNLIAKAPRQINRAVIASTICDDNFSARRSLAQLLKK